MTSSADARLQIWEVWHAHFDYQEGHGYKFQPVRRGRARGRLFERDIAALSAVLAQIDS